MNHLHAVFPRTIGPAAPEANGKPVASTNLGLDGYASNYVRGFELRISDTRQPKPKVPPQAARYFAVTLVAAPVFGLFVVRCNASSLNCFN